MRRLLLSLFSALAARILGGLATPLAPHWGGMRVKHAWHAVPENWENLGHPAHGTTIDLHLALKSQNENALIDALYKVSDPKSLKYGAHLSKEQVAEIVAPHPDTLELVNSWLRHHGVHSSSVSTTLGGNWLTVTGVSVRQANVILGASYQLYRHVEVNATVLRTMNYSLPEALHEHVQTVVPTTYFGSPQTGGKRPHMRPGAAAVARGNAGLGELVRALSSRNEYYITPTFLRRLYNIEGYVPVATDKNALGIAGYLGEFPSPQDLTAFMRVYRTDGSDATFTVEQINGGPYSPDPSQAGMEANLDIQYTEAITYPTPHVYYSTGIGTIPGVVVDPYLSWFAHVLNQERIPQTILTSYGNLEHNVPPDYAKRLCDLFALLGARGVSALFASGDRAVGGGNCLVTDSSGRVRVQFIPEFPASCPWVTTVGGTSGVRPEIGAAFSGGGFSNYFGRPDYQVDVVPTFLKNLGDRHNGLYNPLGRGYPDVSAQAFGFIIARNGQPEYVGGTSASTPVVASIFSLLNDFLLSRGKSPLGFLNPGLYGGGLPGFNDITSGSNPGCGTDGFPAILGWDPVTGLGTPDFRKLGVILERNLGTQVGTSAPTPTN
ncbi:subtilisin-like protein [Lactarius psammicola]|nr:subtilisin-like protein [Lactarius psammicola]